MVVEEGEENRKEEGEEKEENNLRKFQRMGIKTKETRNFIRGNWKMSQAMLEKL